MSRKIIIDCDPGIDDAIAICIALADPRVDVLAVTATAGTVDAVDATQNAGAIINHLDPARYPRIGSATTTENAAVYSDLELHGPGGLGDFRFEQPERQRQTPSEKLIAEMVARHPNEVTLVCLGPLTNLAKLTRRDPSTVSLIDKVVISGGAVNHPGNATAVAEQNMHFDPNSASEVFQSLTTKSLVPLDVTDVVTFGVEVIERLPSQTTRAGQMLHKMLSFAFRAYHQKLGRELLPLYDATALLAVLEPEVFQWEQMAGKVETKGELTRGATVFDRRLRPDWPTNMEVALDVDVSDAESAIVRSLRYAGQTS